MLDEAFIDMEIAAENAKRAEANSHVLFQSLLQARCTPQDDCPSRWGELLLDMVVSTVGPAESEPATDRDQSSRHEFAAEQRTPTWARQDLNLQPTDYESAALTRLSYGPRSSKAYLDNAHYIQHVRPDHHQIASHDKASRRVVTSEPWESSPQPD